ncbi:TonB-dependent siderophore receptor [Paraburkholderia sp.]|uniref:TonB-dependent siderophore receptor n=1 Tax=Paraburkholderia sp. TaxID=1926495 RepID=UPI0039E22B9C
MNPSRTPRHSAPRADAGRRGRAAQRARRALVPTLLALGIATVSSTPQAQGAAPADVAATRSFDIATGSVDTALDAFARRAGVSVSYDAADVRGKVTQGVHGTYAPAAALQRLLDGTGLTAVAKMDGAWVVQPAPAAASTPTGAAATTLPPIKVASTRERETATGPFAGYAATRSATATKTDTSLLETPQAISVIGRNQMQEQGTLSLVDAVRYTPGVQAGTDPVDNRFDSLRIRGFEPTLFLDGMLLPYGASLYGRPKVDPFMLERIEILRGPSSSLYGSIPPGGLVNFVSLRPPEEAVHTVQLQANTFGRYEGAFDVGGPLDKDGTVLYRLTALGFDGGTQIDHTKESRVLVAPSITLRPDRDTSLTFSALYQRDNGEPQIQFLPAQGTLLGNPNGTVPYGKYVGEPGVDEYSRTQAWLGYEFEHRFNQTWKVSQKLRYAYLDTNLFAVAGAGLQADLRTLNRQVLSAPEHAENFTLDNQAQAQFQTGAIAHTVLVGLDYRWQSSRIALGYGSAPSIDLFDTVYGASIVHPPVAQSTSQIQNQVGLYLQDQLAFERWRLTLSGRHDWVDTSTTNRLANTTATQNDSAFSGRVGLSYVFDAGIAPYIAYARSFQPTIGTSFNGTPFQSTTGTQYEAGIKYQPAHAAISANAAAFTLTQSNALTVDPAHPQFQTQSGKVRSQGFELEANAEVAEGLKVIASYTYTDATVIQSNGSDLDKRVIVVPRNQASLWADYTVPRGPLRTFNVGLGVRYFGQTYGNSANTVSIPSNTLVDLALGYELGQLNPKLDGVRFSLNVNNLFNRRYVATCTSLNACYYGTSRVALATLRYDW